MEKTRPSSVSIILSRTSTKSLLLLLKIFSAPPPQGFEVHVSHRDFKEVESISSLLSQELQFSALDVRFRFSTFHSTLLDAIQTHTCSLRFRFKGSRIITSQKLIRRKKERAGV